jgi:hypothetical protein
VLEALVGSQKSEARMRDRARIVLLAADGMASRGIGRAVGCTPGTASKWRGRYAKDRMAGLSETGDWRAEPKYGREHDKRFWRCSIGRRPTAMQTGPRRCCPGSWATPTNNISGGSSGRRRSIFPAANPGAGAQTRSLWRRLTLSVST